jgi:hypothetical protein
MGNGGVKVALTVTVFVVAGVHLIRAAKLVIWNSGFA